MVTTDDTINAAKQAGKVPGPFRRWQANVGERFLGDDPPPTRRRRSREGDSPDTSQLAPSQQLAVARLVALQEYRERSAEVAATPGEAPAPRRRGRTRALERDTPAAGAGRNWVPFGPYAIRRGQAGGEPTVSGRIQDLAVSNDGQRVYAASANGGVWFSGDGGLTWEPTMDSQDLNPHTAVNAAGGAVTQIDTLACGALALVDGGARVLDRLYLGTGEGHPAMDSFNGTGMWTSTDGGGTWSREPVPPPPGAPPPVASVPVPITAGTLVGEGCLAIAVDPLDSDHVVVATTAGLFRRAVVGGVPSWTLQVMPGAMANSTPMTGVAMANQGGNTVTIAVAQGGTPVTSTRTAGVDSAFATLNTGFPTVQVGRCTIAGSKTDPPTFYTLIAYDSPAATGDPSQGTFFGIYHINLGEAPTPTWRKIEDAPDKLFGSGNSRQGWYDQAIVVDPDDESIFYVAGSYVGNGAAIYRCDVTVDVSGATPKVKSSNTSLGERVHPDVHALTFTPGDSKQLWVGCDGGVWVTKNARGGAELMVSRATGLCVVTFSSLKFHPTEESYAFGGVQDNGGIRWSGSDVWDHIMAGDGGQTVVHTGDGSKVLNGYTNASIRKADSDVRRWREGSVDVGLASNEDSQFYPPIISCPGTPTLIAYGAQHAYISTRFGGGWARLPLPTGMALPAAAGGNAPTLRSLAFRSATSLIGGYSHGQIWRWDQAANGTWQSPVPLHDATLLIFGRPVTSICIDPTNNAAFYAAIGGRPGVARMWHGTVTATNPAATPPTAAVTWVSRNGPAATGANRLLDTQHNVVIVDQANPTHVYAGADIGVWRSIDSGANWIPFSPNLPDTPVYDLGIVTVPGNGADPSKSFLRAATHGRGAWEIRLDFAVADPQPAVKLYLRANELDQRQRHARIEVDQPANTGHLTTLRSSPDIRMDPPSFGGKHTFEAGEHIDLVALEDRCTQKVVALSNPEHPVHSNVHAVIHNRGVQATAAAFATLLVGRIPEPRRGKAADEPIPDLPDGWATSVVDNTPINTPVWKTVGRRPVPSVVAGHPVTVTFDVPSDVMPPFREAKDDAFAMLVVLHDPADPLPADASRVVLTLVAQQALAALSVVTPVEIPEASALLNATPGGTGLIIPIATTLLAQHRLRTAQAGLAAKIAAGAAPVGGVAASTVNPTERRVLSMVSAAFASMSGGPSATVPADNPGTGVGQYALAGALGWEVPGYAGLLAPGGAWTADALRRGSADPNMSLVRVLSTELPLTVARNALADGTTSADRDAKIRGYSSGMLCAAAAGLTMSPFMADLLAGQTSRDWRRHDASSGAAAVEDAIRSRLLRGTDGELARLTDWLPTASSVPEEIWKALAAGIESTVGRGETRTKGFASFEATFAEGDALTATRLKNAYNLLLTDAETGSWPAIAWWALLTPFAMSVPVAMLVTRELEHGKAFFTEGADLNERALFEALMAGQTVGAVTPFIYSMILWGLIDEHTEPFVNALLMGLARGALGTAALATASDESLSPEARWLGLFAPLQAVDIYAGIRALAATVRPGSRFVFALNTFPSWVAWLNAGFCTAHKATGFSHTDAGFWAPWSILSAALLGVSIPVAMALEDGGGFQSWFLRDNPGLPVLSATRRAAEPAHDPQAQARVFGDNTMWSLPTQAADPEHWRYPSGMRPLVAVWWEGTGDLEVSQTADKVLLRVGSSFEREFELTAAISPHALAEGLVAALDGVHTEVIATDDPAIELNTPFLADPGDPLDEPDRTTAETRFVMTGRRREDAVILKHAPRVDRSVGVGPDHTPLTSYPVVPSTIGLLDLPQTALGQAADLSVVLSVAAAPTFATVTVADALPALATPQLAEVTQVFKRWNLDHRRIDEWRTLVMGDALEDAVPTPDPMTRVVANGGHPHAAGRTLALEMGWLPLWRAWLSMASDPAADSSAAAASHIDAPEVTFSDGTRKPTNAELTDGIRYLFDLGDPPP